MLPDVDDEQEVITVGKELTGPRVLEVAVVLVVEAPQGLATRQAKDRLSRLSEARDLDVADSSLHPCLGLQVMMGLAEVDLAARCQDAEAAEVDHLVALDRGPAARVLPAAYSHHDVHLLMVPSGNDASKRPAALRVVPRIPTGRVGGPEEIAPAIAWLLGPDAGYITGASIRVAGGL